MNKLIFKLGLLIIPLELIVIATNFYTDPANIFSGEKYIDQIASILASGNNADNISNYNERVFQKHFLGKQTAKPDILVMGSSRVMEINSTFFPGKKLLNIGVSHGNISDLIALTGLADSLMLLPKQIIINVDPFLICQGEKGASEWQSLYTFHNYFLKKNCNTSYGENSNDENNILTKYYTITTFEYFKQSVAFLYKGGSKKIYDVGKETPQKYGRYADGSIAYSYSYSHPDTALIETIAAGTGKIKVAEIDQRRLNLLNCLIDFFTREHIKVSFLMLPFHENYYREVNKRQNNILSTYEEFYNSFAKQKSIPITGSFSALQTNTGKADFYDAFHISANAIKKILLKQ